MKSDLFNQYVTAISDMSGVHPADLFSKNKTRAISDARHILYYVCNKRNMPASYIRKYMSDNGYDIGFHPIAYGIKCVEKKIELDPDYRSIIESVEKSVHF